MTTLDRLMIGCMLATGVLIAGALQVRAYGAERYEAGQAAAVAAGKEARDSQATANLAIESGLRARLLDQDITAFRKGQEYATNLEAAQRRVRAGVDSLRCPAGPVPAATAAAGRPAAGGPESDGAGPAIVPEVAAEILGDGAAVAGLVRRYERLEQRFDACREVNAR